MPMFLRNGVDLIEVSRLQKAVERHGDRFLQRVFTQRELQDCGNNFESLAARFATKEAVSKALGTGIGRIHWKDIEVIRMPVGNPKIVLYGEAKKLAVELGLMDWNLSISHTKDYAIAFVVMWGV